jgi:hypothetical protein
MIRIALSMALIMAAQGAMAACQPSQKTVFRCSTTQGKVIEVCDSGTAIEYSFGRPQAKPEIVVSQPRNAVTTQQWQGIGRYQYYSVNVPNGSTVYSVFDAYDSIDQRRESGVSVEVGGKLVTVKCSGRDTVANIEGIKLRPAQ